MKLLQKFKEVPIETKVLIVFVVLAIIFYGCIIEP